MPLEFRPITLDVESGDSSGLLVLRGGALLAIAAELGDIHGELAGAWFLEIAFHPSIPARPDPFPDIAALGSWLGAQFA